MGEFTSEEVLECAQIAQEQCDKLDMKYLDTRTLMTLMCNYLRAYAALLDRQAQWPSGAQMVPYSEASKALQVAYMAGTEGIGYNEAAAMLHAAPHPPKVPDVLRVYVCSNPKCGSVHRVEPYGHCPSCVQPSGSGWSTLPKDVI